MKAIKRTAALLTSVLVLGSSALANAGCGSTSHFVAAVGVHHVIDHFVTSAAGQRRVNKAFCLYHGHRVIVDLRTHHAFAAGLNAIAAYNACKGGFGRQH